MEGPGKTMESRQPEGTGSNNDLARSAALSSADLWHEILERLNEVQEGQLRLARAIESLGMIVCDALAVDPQAALNGAAETTALPRTQQRVPLAAGPPSQSAVEEHLASSERDLAASQRTIDSLLSSDVFAPASSTPATEKVPDVPTPAVAATGSSTSPRFYVAPVPEQNRQVEREPVSSGAWPGGRRVARGLAREGPSMAGPSVVPNLTPAAMDALLAAEFGDATAAPSPPRPQLVPAAQAGPLLNSLLGAEFSPAPSMPAATTALLNRPPPSGARPAPATPPSVRPPMAPSSPVAPPPVPSSLKPTPSMAPVRPPAAMSTAPPVAPSSHPPAAAPPGDTAWTPTADPRRTPPVPRPTPTAVPAPVLPPPVPPQPRASGAPGSAGGQNLADGPGPAPGDPEDSPMRSGPLGAVSGAPAPFAPGTPNAADPAATAVHPNADSAPQSTKPRDSAASMATEILSASPHAPVAEPTEATPTTLAEDVTIMAKGRRRRFRLR